MRNGRAGAEASHSSLPYIRRSALSTQSSSLGVVYRAIGLVAIVVVRLAYGE